jgi:hypothetical protein
MHALPVVFAEKYRAAHLKNNPDYPQVRFYPPFYLPYFHTKLTIQH